MTVTQTNEMHVSATEIKVNIDILSLRSKQMFDEHKIYWMEITQGNWCVRLLRSYKIDFHSSFLYLTFGEMSTVKHCKFDFRFFEINLGHPGFRE